MDNDLDFDVFGHPYLDMLWYLQDALINDKATVNDMDFTLNDFCYKPISGEGCIVESPMQYFWDNLTTLQSNDNE